MVPPEDPTLSEILVQRIVLNTHLRFFTHTGGFYRCKVLTADVKDFCQLLLRIPLFLAIVSDCIGEIFHALRKVEIPFQSYHRLMKLVYLKAAITKINPKALLTLNKRHYIITTLFC